MRRNRLLHDRFAGLADPLAAHVVLDLERPWDVVQLLGHVLADPLHLAATAADRRVGLVLDRDPRQVDRQVSTDRDLLRLRVITNRIQLDLDRPEVLVDRLLKQVPLQAVELSAARPKRQRFRIAISWDSCEIFRSFQWISLFLC